MLRPLRARALLLPVLALLAGGLAGATPAATTPPPILIGAVFPLTGSAAALAKQEEAGVQIAQDLVNGAGGVRGRQVELVVRDLESPANAPAVMAALRAAGVTTVVGAYASDLSIAASAAANAEGLVYWEAGAVADRLTGRGLPLTFRVGASGTNLGEGSATFTTSELAPRLGITPAALRVAIVAADDAYATSVADAAETVTRADGVRRITRIGYRLTAPDWARVMAGLRVARPDVIMLTSHIPDGIAFRRAMLAAHVHAKALIGTTMAQCDPDFASDLGTDAIGVFAADRPTGGFQPSALAPAAASVYRQLAAAWAQRAPASTGREQTDAYGAYGNGTREEYAIHGPVLSGSAAAGPTEEVLSGFTAAWVLFHDVLPAADASGALSAAAIARAAQDLDLPAGSLPNGAGLRFSSDPRTLGQNLRANAVIWQWQAIRSYTYVWPVSYATGQVAFVPLPR
jgi:branched-chain amino acid transport system substrate-binding protein